MNWKLTYSMLLQNPVPSTDNKLYDKYLGTIQCFLRQGVHRLCHTVQRNVERELLRLVASLPPMTFTPYKHIHCIMYNKSIIAAFSVSLKHKMTPETLRQMINSVRQSVESSEVYEGVSGRSAFAEYVATDPQSTLLAQVHTLLSYCRAGCN